jgi:hypothetical protein
MYLTSTARSLFFIAIGSIAFFFSCTRIRSTDVGAGLIPPIDGVITKDTILDVITETFENTDSARIYRADNHLLGAISNDPLFGKTRASLYFEVKPTGYPFYIPGTRDSIIADSAVLVLSFQGLYGDSTTPLRLTVSEIDPSTPLDPGVNYPSNYPAQFPVKIKQSLVSNVTIDPRRLMDSVKNRFENAKNQIRIRLPQSVAQRFIKTYDSTNAYINDSTFRTYFAGFAVTADAAAGSNVLLKVNLADTNTKFMLYYNSNTTGATQRDTGVVKLTFNTSLSGDANMIVRDRTGSEASKHITTTTKPDSLVYIQTYPGTYVQVRIPGLQGLSNRIIHRAELIAEQVPDDANLATLETQMVPPRYLLLSRYDTAIKSQRNIPNDYVIGQSGSGPNISTFGGFVTAKSLLGYDKVAAYNFDISRYVQGVITRKDTSYVLRISAPNNDSLRYTPPYPTNTYTVLHYVTPAESNDVGDGRVRLGGGTHSRFRMRLRVIFSRI